MNGANGGGSSSLTAKLPEEYCPGCAQERPEEFEFIRQAEERGAIVFTAFCVRHAVEFLREQAGFLSPRECNGWVVCEVARGPAAGQVWRSTQACVPASGMKFRAEGRAS